ncbi:uncharacterized protein L201_005292 [Kwoniella dendrophila CBS 6074]|uniref:BTB domain-containing protein n=1 Tax=Kwoniella dendrophila CBS 6074 TaxID=1295534 RepID=A0AAX4JYT8_9TREE
MFSNNNNNVVNEINENDERRIYHDRKHHTTHAELLRGEPEGDDMDIDLEQQHENHDKDENNFLVSFSHPDTNLLQLKSVVSNNLNDLNNSINQKESFTLKSAFSFSSSSSTTSNANVHIDSQSSFTSPFYLDNSFDSQTHISIQSSASSPSNIHNKGTSGTSSSQQIHPSSLYRHAFNNTAKEAQPSPPVGYTQNQYIGQSTASATGSRSFTPSPLRLYSPLPASPQSLPNNNNRPIPLRLGSANSSSSTSSVRSARRLGHSPYIIPQTAKLIPTSSPPSNMTTVTVKDEPRTPVPLPSSFLPDVKDEVLDHEHDDILKTPKRLVQSPPIGSRIGSSPGSMSMSQRRGVRPSFPTPRMVRTSSGPLSGSGSGNGNNNNNNIMDTRGGLLTPQHSASSSSSSSTRPQPYNHHNSIPLLSAPLSPPQNSGKSNQSQRWHQSAPAAGGITTPITPHYGSNGNCNLKGKGKQNTYQVSLDEIPKDFVLKKLVQLASKYWYAPHSADCHIIVPIKRASRSPNIPSTPRTAIPSSYQRFPSQLPNRQTAQPGDSFFGPQTPTAATIQAAAQVASVKNGNDVKPDVLNSSVTNIEANKDFSGRRGSLPGGNQLEQCLVFPLHKDYLTTQSVLFRTLLNSQAAHLPNPPPRDQEGRLLFQSPVIRGAKVLPTKSDRPKALYVPLPDPASFGVILHWLYWHDADHFNHCLSKGLVTWQGIIRNIEYLSLDNEIKLLAGKWWKRWVKPTESNERRRTNTTTTINNTTNRDNMGKLRSTSCPNTIKGKRRSYSTSEARKDKLMNIDHFDDDDDDDEDDNIEEEEEEVIGDSGDEADDEDGIHIKRELIDNDGFADHVSLKLGGLQSH